MTLGNTIAQLRKGMNLTQDGLAQQLGVTNQAVSKWESGQCCPDVTLLPQIADFFGISLDELFGRTVPALPIPLEQKIAGLPWDDDNVLRAVVYVGHRLAGYKRAQPGMTILYSRDVDAVEANMSVQCGNVDGDVNASGNVTCGNVGGDVNADGSVCSSEVGGDVDAGGSVNCFSVGGDVDAGGDVTCGSVEPGSSVNRCSIGGDVDAGGNVNCGNIGGDVDAGGDVTCGSVGGDVDAGGNVNCGDVEGSVDAGSNVKCGNVGGDIDAGGHVVIQK